LLGDFKPMLDTIAEYFIGFEKKDIFIKQICRCSFAFHKNQKVIPKPIKDDNPDPIFSQIKPCRGEFKDIFLLEASKSCKYNCRFCTTGYNLRPYRKIESQKIIETIKNQRYSDQIGIISAAFGDIRNLSDILDWMIENSLKISVSSLRVDSITKELIERLKILKVRTITIAEETASEKLKQMIGKNIKKESIFSAVEKIATLGIENLKLYYMIGFYGEDENDMVELIHRIDEICHIFKENQIKGYNRLGKIKASINIFNPKPFTPMQFFGLITKDEYEEKLKILYSLKKVGNLKVDIMPYNQAVLQTTIAKAESNIKDFYRLYIDNQFNEKKALKLFDNGYIYKNYEHNDILPWDNIIYPNISRDIINMEYKRCLQALKDYSR
ncbi:MAG: radical SAM protein, partial [Calditerrivibrio sp.]|nr:radical SAM protein [Calditerrivibrio sp.]